MTSSLITAVQNAFSRFLAEFRKGESLTELTSAMQTVVKSVRDTGKPAQLTYKVTVRPAGKGNALVIDDEIITKLPKPDRSVGIFFASEDGFLSRDNPDQKELPLKAIEEDGDTEDLKEIAQ